MVRKTHIRVPLKISKPGVVVLVDLEEADLEADLEEVEEVISEVVVPEEGGEQSLTVGLKLHHLELFNNLK
jgi:hypothetical protein